MKQQARGTDEKATRLKAICSSSEDVIGDLQGGWDVSVKLSGQRPAAAGAGKPVGEGSGCAASSGPRDLVQITVPTGNP